MMEDKSSVNSVPDSQAVVIRNKLDFTVVGIGASADGVSALLRFFENMPADNGMAFLVILPLSPEQENHAHNVLQRATRMPVIRVIQAEAIEKNRVYVISPTMQLSMNDGLLGVAELEHPREQHAAVDLFFHTLADAHKERSIGIVLSGAGADGAVGLARLKEQGGIIIAEHPLDAACDGMPCAAIDANIVDFVLPVADMPQKLIDITGNPRMIHLPQANKTATSGLPVTPVTSDKETTQELRNVISVLSSQTERDIADIIGTGVVNHDKLREDLRDLSRVNTGKLALELTSVNLCGAVTSIVEAMQADPAAANLHITVDCTHGDAMIRADRVRIEQVILNLLSNAIKVTPAGGSIALQVTRDADMVRLDVTDSGDGIAPENLPRIFDMFGLAESVTMGSKGGLGIRLMLVRHIVELHGGRVAAASGGIGSGTCFSVWLPLYQEPAILPAMQRITRPPGIAGLHILLVDDMEDIVDGLKMLLEFEGATVYTANNALAALDMIDGLELDLMLSDVGMPEMDGYTLIREVRKKPRFAKLPAIALTGFGRMEDAERAREVGFSAHLSKPVMLDALIRTAVELCRK